MLSCSDCGRPIDKAEHVTCKSCISKEVDSLLFTKNNLRAEVAELKDAIQLTVLEDPEKITIIKENSLKLNELATQLTKQKEEEMIRRKHEDEEEKELESQRLRALEAEHEAKTAEQKLQFENLLNHEMEKQKRFEEKLDNVTRTVAEQREQLLENIKLCFKISLTQINNIDYLQILHFKIPMDGNYNRMAPDDLNAVLGHVAQITVHMSRIFGFALPFDLVPNMPITYIKVGSDHNNRILLWMNSQDPTGRTTNKFVTAVALLNFCIAWLASAVLPADSVDGWNGMRNFWAIISGWTADMPLRRPSASLAQVVRETMYCWNLQTGDNVTPCIPIERFSSAMQCKLLHS